jgi:hypothetical protein
MLRELQLGMMRVITARDGVEAAVRELGHSS